MTGLESKTTFSNIRYFGKLQKTGVNAMLVAGFVSYISG